MKILIGKIKPTKCEVFASEELQNFLKKVTGKTLSIEDTFVENEKYISVGNTELSDRYVGVLDEKEYKLDGYIIKNCEGHIIILGARDRGTLYGVYDFLDRYYGVKFLTKDCTVINKQDFYIPDADIKEIPKFSIRCHRVYDYHVDPLFRARHRVVTLFGEEVESYGYNLKRDCVDFGHNTLSIVRPELYADNHPEFFVWVEGKPVDICWSNGIDEDFNIENKEISVAKILLDWLIKQVEDNPSASYFGINMEDSMSNYCRCKRCSELKEKFGAPNVTTIIALIAVAKAIKEYSEKYLNGREVNIFTLAYNWTERPPVLVDEKGRLYCRDERLKFPDNLYMKLALSSGNFARSFDDKRQGGSEFYNLTYEQVFDGWKLLNAGMQMYDYGTNFYEYLWYHPYMRVAKQNYKYYESLGIDYVEVQSEHNTYQGFFASIKGYVVSKLLWDYNADINKHIKDYCDGYYGSESAVIYNFVKEMEDRITYLLENTDYAMYMFLRNYGKSFSEEYFPTALVEKHFNAIEKAIERNAENPDMVRRLSEAIVLPARMLTVYADEKHDKQRENFYAKKFIDYCDIANIETSSEGWPMMQLKENGPILGGGNIKLFKEKYSYKV